MLQDLEYLYRHRRFTRGCFRTWKIAAFVLSYLPMFEIFVESGTSPQSLEPVLRMALELISHFAQGTLIMATAAERFVMICHGEKAPVVLTMRNRLISYSVCILYSLLMPALIVADHVGNKTSVARLGTHFQLFFVENKGRKFID